MSSKFLSRFVRRSAGVSSAIPQQVPLPTATVAGLPLGLEVVVEGIDPIVDIVAVHGLNGHRNKTWTANTGVHWLRDLLPADLPQARVLCWGYDANTHANSRMSCQYLYDHALNLVADLCRKRKLTNSTERPIIFVAHSLGGIIVKSALIHSDASRQGALHEHRSVKVSTHGIIFMGTPHQGGNGVQLGRLLMNAASLFVAADDRILQHLLRDSEWLQQQLGQYGQIGGDFVTKFAYEEYETPTALGHKLLVVPRASAVVPGQADAEQFVIHADHINMVKFLSRNDSGYETVAEHLQIMVMDAGDRIRSRWETEKRIDGARDSNSPSVFNLPLSLSEHPSVTHFFAREEELSKIDEILQKPEGRRTVIIHGLGGMGKTQLAIAYMIRHRADYAAALWFNARDQTSLKQSFARAASRIVHHYPALVYLKNAVDGRKFDVIVLAVKRWLDEPRNDRWLAIFDNYDEPKLDNRKVGSDITVDERASSQMDTTVSEAFDIRHFLPNNEHGAVIVTTRSSEVKIGQLIRLKKLENVRDSLDILASTSNRKDLDNDRAAIDLAHLLDGLPLALSTAGAYLHQVSTSWTEYLELYKKRWLQLQKESPQLLLYEYALYSTWDISYSHVKRQNPIAAVLLQLWAYFDNDDLWYELLRDGELQTPGILQGVTLDRISFDQTMRVLCSHGLVEPLQTRECGAESHGYSVHGCVHSWIKYALTQVIDVKMVWFAMRCVASHVPEKTEPEYWWTQRRLLLHANQCLEMMTKGIELQQGDEWIPDSLGSLYRVQDRLSDAEVMFERALRGKERALGPNHTSTLDTIHKLGHLYTTQDRLSDAEAMFERALRGKEQALGPEHTSTLDTVDNLGILYRVQGRLSDAEAMFERALQGRERALGPDHISTLDTVHNLGSLYKAQDRLSEAEAMFERALRGTEITLGPDHTSTLGTVDNLGSLYKAQGRLSDAEVMFERALRGKERALGPDHTSTLDTVHNLGNLYRVQDRLSDAEAMFERALQGTEKTLGPNHTSTLDTVDNLGNLYRVQGRLSDAEAMFERALQGTEKTLGPDHTWTLDTVHNLGSLYIAQGRLSDAEAMFERALQGTEKTLGPDHTSTLGTVNNLGYLYKAQGRLSDAEVMFERALRGKERVLGPDHTSTLDTVHNLGSLYRVQDRLSDAEAMFERALQGTEKTLGPNHTSTLDTVDNLGYLYKAQGRLSDAEAMFERALRGRERALGPDHTSTLDTVHNLGNLYRVQGRLSDAEAMFERALRGYSS